jgi:predicted nucleic acid-binding protein
MRSADALHLVSAREHGMAAIYSNDARVLEAAPAFGIRGMSV